MKVWITKYALTEGVRETNVDWREDRPEIVEERLEGQYWSTFYRRNDWHRTKEAALARAEEMRADRVKSLRKSLERLEKLTFA